MMETTSRGLAQYWMIIVHMQLIDSDLTMQFLSCVLRSLAHKIPDISNSNIVHVLCIFVLKEWSLLLQTLALTKFFLGSRWSGSLSFSTLINSCPISDIITAFCHGVPYCRRLEEEKEHVGEEFCRRKERIVICLSFLKLGSTGLY
jgi:hypothetical protein